VAQTLLSVPNCIWWQPFLSALDRWHRHSCLCSCHEAGHSSISLISRPSHPRRNRDTRKCNQKAPFDAQNARKRRFLRTPSPAKPFAEFSWQSADRQRLPRSPGNLVKYSNLWRNSQLTHSKANIKCGKISQNLPRNCHNVYRYSQGTPCSVPFSFAGCPMAANPFHPGTLQPTTCKQTHLAWDFRDPHGLSV
jgi:hypothetical protein